MRNRIPNNPIRTDAYHMLGQMIHRKLKRQGVAIVVNRRLSCGAITKCIYNLDLTRFDMDDVDRFSKSETYGEVYTGNNPLIKEIMATTYIHHFSAGEVVCLLDSYNYLLGKVGG